MFLVKNFKYARGGLNKDKASLFNVSSSHYKVLKPAFVNYLKRNESMIIKPKEEYNLLKTDSVEMHCMIALGTGCDTLSTGIKGVDTAFIKDKITKNNTS